MFSEVVLRYSDQYDVIAVSAFFVEAWLQMQTHPVLVLPDAFRMSSYGDAKLRLGRGSPRSHPGLLHVCARVASTQLFPGRLCLVPTKARA